jgi:hypothetical protein
MLKPFTTKIQTILTERANEVEEQVLMPDPHYQKLNTKINDILDQIGQNLPLLKVKRETCKEEKSWDKFNDKEIQCQAEMGWS